MLTKPSSAIQMLETPEDVNEARIEAIGFIFHGMIPRGGEDVKRPAVRAGVNILHFARCPKIDKAAGTEAKIWFRSVGVAKAYLDANVGLKRWSWCKICQREITQKVLDEQ